jgi:hypothetical protein
MRSRALIVIAALGLAVAGCSNDGQNSSSQDTGGLTRQQYAAAVNVARHEVENQDAKVTSATAVLKHNAGKNAPSNTGTKCTGDQVLRVRLIGTFPHIVTTGTPGHGGGRATEVDIKADPESENACLIGVRTGEVPRPEPGATVLQLDD